MGIPSGFYPSNFGYRMSDVHNEETGIFGTLQLEGNGRHTEFNDVKC
jgi:hypothetical protein